MKGEKKREYKETNISTLNSSSNPDEQYRMLRNRVNYSSLNQEFQTFLVTSPSFKEGKTEIAANLAVSMAQQGKKTLLIDANFNNPSLHKVFNAKNNPGLIDMSHKNNRLNDLIIPTKQSNLFFLPTGLISEGKLEGLNTERLNCILTEAKILYKVIIFDSASLLFAADTQMLANFCEGVLLVIKSGKTKKKELIKAKKILNESTSVLIGAILNEKKHSMAL